MPTGYTAKIADGITFEEYALGCARAFGALIMMRDEPTDAPIPESFEPETYNTRHVAETRDRIAKLNAMTPAQREKACRDYVDKRTAEISASEQRDRDLLKKYETMLKAVDAYNAPSSEHVEYKKFMRTQIEESIKFDCGLGSWRIEERNGLDSMTPALWYEREMNQATCDLKYHTKAQGEEEECAAKRTKWVKLLRESLETSPF